MAIVMSAKEFVSLGIDSDEFTVAPGAGTAHINIDVISHRFELFGNLGGEILFNFQTIGQILMVEARRIGSLLDVDAVVDDANKVARDSSDDRGSPGGTENVALWLGQVQFGTSTGRARGLRWKTPSARSNRGKLVGGLPDSVVFCRSALRLVAVFRERLHHRLLRRISLQLLH
jgi:hypothetical protein